MNAEEILSKMSIKEKLMLTSGLDFWHLVSNEEKGVPSIMVTDGPHGLRKKEGPGMGIGDAVPSVAFPTASCSACSWDKELLHEMGKAMGEECVQEKVSVILGPGVNMKRSPLCGRNFEYFSEDPVLAGEMAAALINGVQETGVGTSLKHYAVNNQETFRMTGSSNLDERTLREYYLQPFEIAVKKSQPTTIMTSYNKINNVPASGNAHLNTDILRNEWGFKGVVLTDWGGGHCHYEDLNGGLDLEMPGNKQLYLKETLKAYQAGKISEETINRAALNVLKLIEKTEFVLNSDYKYNVDEHHAIAKKVALGSIVLLKNSKNILPLNNDVKPLVIGEMAEKPRYQGAGSSHLNPQKLDTFLSSLDAAGIAYDYEKGYESANVKDESFIDAAVAKVNKDQPVLLFIGLTDDYESEGADRLTMAMPETHVKLAEKILEKSDNVVVVLSAGSPVELPFEAKATTIIDAYLSGEAGASALVDIVYGKVSPSGKLAETWPISKDDVPCSDTYALKERNQVNYREAFFSGYRYFNSAKVDVQYPFGYGLSYTTFEYSNLKVEGNTVSVDVTNTGAVDGAEVVQLYVSNKTKATIFAENELRNFEKVFLKAGETKTVKMELTDRDFQFFSVEKNAYVIAKGDYEIQIGASSRDIKLRATVTKDGEEINELEKFAGSWFETFNGKPTDDDMRLLGVEPIYEKAPRKGDYTLENTALDVKEKGFGKFFFGIMQMAVRAALGIKKSEADQIQNKMMIDSAINISFRGMSAMSNGIMQLWLASFIVKCCNGFSKPSKKEDK